MINTYYYYQKVYASNFLKAIKKELVYYTNSHSKTF